MNCFIWERWDNMQIKQEWRPTIALVGIAVYIIVAGAVALTGLYSITDWGRVW